MPVETFLQAFQPPRLRPKGGSKTLAAAAVVVVVQLTALEAVRCHKGRIGPGRQESFGHLNMLRLPALACPVQGGVAVAMPLCWVEAKLQAREAVSSRQAVEAEQSCELCTYVLCVLCVCAGCVCHVFCARARVCVLCVDQIESESPGEA